MNFKNLATAVCLLSATACAFFEEPLDDLGTLTLPAPNDRVPAAKPIPTPKDSVASNTGNAPQSPQITTVPDGTYFTVATLFAMPENATNISFVHFADSSNKDTRRTVAMCKTLLDTYPATKPADVPANANHLIVWPVRTESSDANCIGMVSDYEAIDISNETAKKIQPGSAGPLLLTRNTPARKRLIYDFSYVKPASLPKALREWELLVGSAADSWPAYQSAR